MDQNITLEPIPLYGSIAVESEPYGAEIWLDGKQYGTTPNVLDQVLATSHTLRLAKSGCADYNSTVTVRQGEESQVSAKLEPVSNNSVVSDNGKANSETVIAGTDREFTVNGVTFKMIYIEGGTFTMGASGLQVMEVWKDEETPHSVTLSSYLLGETEVTQALWQAVMGKNPSYWESSNLPVEGVSWNDCQEFIKTLNSLTGQNFSLPTEAQWEYAAKGGKHNRGFLYAGSDNIKYVAWCDENSGYKTHPVATKAPNELGLYDMSGNVWEWCNDLYGSYDSTAQTNPSGASSGSSYVLRGGSWDHHAVICRVSKRIDFSPDYSGNSLGLRLALSL